MPTRQIILAFFRLRAQLSVDCSWSVIQGIWSDAQHFKPPMLAGWMILLSLQLTIVCMPAARFFRDASSYLGRESDELMRWRTPLLRLEAGGPLLDLLTQEPYHKARRLNSKAAT